MSNLKQLLLLKHTRSWYEKGEAFKSVKFTLGSPIIFLPDRNEISFSFLRLRDNGKNNQRKSPIDENLPDGVQRTASELHMRFVQQRAASVETTMVLRQQE